MNRFAKAWDGGKPPELSATDLAFVAHMEACPNCQGAWSVCPEGARLYDAVVAQYDGHSHDPAPEIAATATESHREDSGRKA